MEGKKYRIPSNSLKKTEVAKNYQGDASRGLSYLPKDLGSSLGAPPVRVSSMVLFDLVDDDGEALSRWTRDWSPTEGMGVAFAACEPLTQSVHAENAERGR